MEARTGGRPLVTSPLCVFSGEGVVEMVGPPPSVAPSSAPVGRFEDFRPGSTTLLPSSLSPEVEFHVPSLCPWGLEGPGVGPAVWGRGQVTQPRCASVSPLETQEVTFLREIRQVEVPAGVAKVWPVS